MMNKLRIVLADDHAIIREGLKAMINSQPDMMVVGEASNGRAAWQKVNELEPDLVVMDVSMPELNGALATERIKQSGAKVKVLALTIHEDNGYLRQLLKAGATGYVLKQAATEDLIHAIRMVAAGGTYIDPMLASKMVNSYARPQSISDDATHRELSDRESEVLRLVARGYSNKEIAGQLSISVKTVETYKSRLSEKLDLHSRSEMVRYALHRGWLQNM